MAHRLPRLAATAAGLALLTGPAAAADPGDRTPLGTEVGIEGGVGLDRDAPIADVTSELPTSTTIDVDVGETPEYDVGVEDYDEIPQAGDSLDAYEVIGDADTEEALIGDVDTAPGEDIIDAPDVGDVPELGDVGREEDPIPDTVEPLPERRGFEY